MEIYIIHNINHIKSSYFEPDIYLNNNVNNVMIIVGNLFSVVWSFNWLIISALVLTASYSIYIKPSDYLNQQRL